MDTPYLSQHVAFEVLEDGLPVVVGACRADRLPTMTEGQELRLLLSSRLNREAAERVAAARVRQVCRWATGDPDTAPEWFRSRLPVPPSGRPCCRPVERVWPDGRVERFASVLEAAAVLGRDRVVVMRRLQDGQPDATGAVWRDCRA